MEQSDKNGAGRLKNAILITGPTASGKSSFAIELARRRNGVIINADSMQVYSVLRVVTARPDETDVAAVPHRLYGHVHPSRSYSTGAWLGDVEKLVEQGEFHDCTPIFTGGTGLYFRALLGGLSEIPQIPQHIRDRWRGALAEEGPAQLHAQLSRKDPGAASGIRPSDRQRIVRALEVLEATGRSITSFRQKKGRPLVDPKSAERYLIEPPRAALHARIEARFDRMLAQGALDEIVELMSLGLDPALPAMKAIGVRELNAAVSGELSLPAAIEKAKAATRQYAKRQSTWFRHQLGPGWQRTSNPFDGPDGP
jgi:tRNA dimethylallyltransferase